MAAHGRCEWEGPARSVGGMEQSGRFLTDSCETGGKRSINAVNNCAATDAIDNQLVADCPGGGFEGEDFA